MKITVSQQGKKIIIEFQTGKTIPGILPSPSAPPAGGSIPGIRRNKYTIDKAEEFLVCVDKLLKKHHTVKISDFRDARLEFEGRVGMLTERVVRAIMLGLCF